MSQVLVLLVNRGTHTVLDGDYLTGYDEATTEWYDAGDLGEYYKFIDRVPTLGFGEQIGMKNCSKEQVLFFGQNYSKEMSWEI